MTPTLEEMCWETLEWAHAVLCNDEEQDNCPDCGGEPANHQPDCQILALWIGSGSQGE